jgi:hypothetical protein
MIIFRPKRELLDDAMAAAREYENEDEMKKDIVKEFNGEVDLDDIEIKPAYNTIDTRIGWNNCKDVCIKRYGYDNFMKKYGHSIYIGTCASDYTLQVNKNS